MKRPKLNSLLAIAIVFAWFPSIAAAQSMTVVIKRYTIYGTFDKFTPPDVQGRVKIDGELLVNPIIGDRYEASPNWIYSRQTAAREVNVEIMLWDFDSKSRRKRPDSIDISPKKGRKRLKFVFYYDGRGCNLGWKRRERPFLTVQRSPDGIRCVFDFSMRGNNKKKGARVDYRVTYKFRQ